MEKATALYRDVLGATVSEKVPLPDHGVYTVFVELGNTKLELLHPLGEKSPISGFLQKNKSGGMHHICIEVRRRWQGRAFITFLHDSASFICSRDPKFTRLNSEFVHFRTSSCLRLLWRVYNEWVYWYKALVALVFYSQSLPSGSYSFSFCSEDVLQQNLSLVFYEDCESEWPKENMLSFRLWHGIYKKLLCCICYVNRCSSMAIWYIYIWYDLGWPHDYLCLCFYFKIYSEFTNTHHKVII